MSTKKPGEAFAVVLAVALALAALAGPARAGVVLDRVVAVVDKQAITWSELTTAMESELMRTGGGRLPEAQRRRAIESNQAAFLESMVDALLQLQEAERRGVRTSDRDVDQAIANIKDKYKLSDEALAASVGDEGYTVESYRTMLREQIAIRRVVDQEVRANIEVTDRDVADYLKENGLTDGTRYLIRQIFLRALDDAGREAARTRARELAGRLGQGEDFIQAALKNSDDPAVKETGGNLGLIEKEHMSPEFAAAVEGLKTGGVSEPFETGLGVHIVRVEDIIGVRDVLREKRFDQAYRQWLKGLRDRAFIRIKL